MQLYCQEKGIKLFEEFNLEKYNPHIRIVNAILYNDKEKKAITKKLEGINDAVVLEQLWDMLMVKGRTFEGWIDSKDVF